MITYEEFIKGREVFETKSKAQAKGFEAHHIVPKALQTKPDDRCVRLTPFEHIFAHYLLALETKEPSMIFAFNAMTNWNTEKLSDIEQTEIKSLEFYANLKEEAKDKISKKAQERFKDPCFLKKYKESHSTDEYREKISKKLKGRTLSEETKKRISESKKGTHSKNKGKTMKEITGNPNYQSKYKGIPLSDDMKQKVSEATKKAMWRPDVVAHRLTVIDKMKVATGTTWWNNGEVEIRRKEQPIGYVKGRLPKNKEHII